MGPSLIDLGQGRIAKYLHQPQTPTVLKVEANEKFQDAIPISEVHSKQTVLDLLEKVVKDLTDNWSTTLTRKQIEERWYKPFFKK